MCAHGPQPQLRGQWLIDRVTLSTPLSYTDWRVHAALRRVYVHAAARQARSREINLRLIPHSPRVGAVRAALADTRGEVRTNTGDQTGREGGQKVFWDPRAVGDEVPATATPDVLLPPAF
jgi:hypothetical protein